MSDTQRPPTPDGWPVVGNAVQFMREPFDRLEEWCDLNDVVRLRMPMRRTYLVTDPALIEAVLVAGPDRYERGELVRQSFGPLRDNALSAQEGDRWRRLRNQFQPAFTPASIETATRHMVEHAGAWAADCEDGAVIDVETEMRRLTLRILAEALFDIDVQDSAAGDAVRTVAAAISKRADYTTLTPYLPDWAPTPANRRFQKAMATLRAAVAERIERRKATLDEQADPDEHSDFLTTLVAMQERGEAEMTDDELRDNVIGFLWAGQDTTAVALACLWYLLATHPEKRERLETELESVLGGDRPTMADLPALSYLDSVVDETLRLYPPGPTTPREPTEDVELGGYEIPAGSTLIMPQWSVHRDERYFDDPEAFRPERWTDEFEADLPEYAYFPFGGGPRHCIGMRFAKAEMALTVATVAQELRFESHLEEAPSFRLTATLTPDTEMRMRVHRR